MMKRRAASFFLILALLLCLLPVAGNPTLAASEEAQEAAELLYELGLFSGTGTDENGDPIFELDRAPTRHEAITMLVRLLGKEPEALAGVWELPFTDVSAWAKPYVGYAYTNKLTSGTSATTFSGNNTVSAAQYITFVLRALGYNSESDFRWNSSWELSDRLGITDGRYNASTENFTRGDVAVISASALYATLKDSEKTLLMLLGKDVRDENVDDEACVIRPLGMVRQTSALKPYDGVEPYGEFWYDASSSVRANLSSQPGLAYSLTYSNRTQFWGQLPLGFDPQEQLEWGKYPGLNIDILHAHGFTGKGAVIAYVDQPASPHEQYSGNNVHFTNNSESASSMHGPAVLSLLSGKDIGVAPEAEVYFYGHAAWKANQETHAECLYQIIEQNKKLPFDKRIRMVGFSDNIDEREANPQALRDAVKACEDAGIMVWFCGENGSVSIIPGSDKNSVNSIMPAPWGSYDPDLVYVPAGGRTTAYTESGAQYIYWSEGGLSWTMPYTLGLYAIAIEIDPGLTQDELRAMIVDTAYINDVGQRIVNPVGFVAAALKGVGRDEEAQAMLDEVQARTRYLYAVMDTAAMTEDDLIAVGSYLASITDASVLVVDAASFADAQSLYAAMQQDAMERGGTVSGVQIFGTASMVPTFQIGYKVQMPSGIDDGGTLLTDLFYGNFNNDAASIGPDYNVMEHMEKGWDVDLIPQWPVVRLPLSAGEFAAFFEKYKSFVLDNGLERLDIVNFSNPIFQQKEHNDDMGRFLAQRIDREFSMMDVPYRLYGNLKGDCPVTNSVLGGFEAKNMTAENEKASVEFLINTHGQWDNIDNAIFVNGEEQRISLVNMDNINTILGFRPYYLDAWTCLNGYGMENNLTTTALAGKCVGMFSATAIISNNGAIWNVSVPEMARSNFYYFYYSYLRALHEGNTRSQAFFTAQREYGIALMEDSKLPLRGEGNYQLNLYNLLAYHNFGVIEPNAACLALCDSLGYIGQAADRIPKSSAPSQNSQGSSIKLTDGKPVGNQKAVNNYANLIDVTVTSLTAQALDNGYTRFTLVYTAAEKKHISVFNPPNGDRLMMLGNCLGTSEPEELVFDLSDEELRSVEGITIMFYVGEENRSTVYFRTDF